MFVPERIKKIKELLSEYKHVDVNSLSSLLSVSVATVRRDLEKLEEEGFLKKTHGGAFLVENDEYEFHNSNYVDPYLNEKMQIGLIASEMIDNNDIVFLGNGNTCLQIAKNIKSKKKVTVITNNINVIIELAYCQNIDLIATGGKIETTDSDLIMYGTYAQNNIDRMYLYKTFFTVDAISLEFGYSVNNNDQALFYQSLIKNSKEVIVVADYSKFDKRAFAQVGPINLFKKIITNVNVDSKYKEFFYDSDIKLYTAYEQIREYKEQ